jgi:hypothetical protein
MANEFWSKRDCYRQWVDESLATANSATSNRIRAELYAAAEYYLHLSEVEEILAKQKQAEECSTRLDRLIPAVFCVCQSNSLHDI